MEPALAHRCGHGSTVAGEHSKAGILGLEGLSKLYSSVQPVAAKRQARSGTSHEFSRRTWRNPAERGIAYSVMTHEERRACALNFSWVLNRVLAGSRGPRTDSDLAALYDFGIRAIVRLADTRETGLNAEDVEGHRLRDCYEP